MNVLLVEPDFPYPTKSKHKASTIHKNFIPIGLLKLGALHKERGDLVKLVRGLKTQDELEDFVPQTILITSIFTYWSNYVWDTVAFYRKLFPESEIVIGGIYVTLHYNMEEFQTLAKQFNVKWHVGLHKGAERYLPDYSLLDSDVEYHATHAMRGCIRRCKFCGTWRIEPELIYKDADGLANEILEAGKNKVIFFDNNFFANPKIKEILKRLKYLRVNNKPIIFESQSGYDGRLIAKDPELAELLKKARFRNIRIAWDNSVSDHQLIRKQLDHLVEAGYPIKDISVFMIYNFDISYEEMLEKLDYCAKWGVQITDCRYRPLDGTCDNYKPSAWRTGQTEEDYYIHTKRNWTDDKIRAFRKKVRQHNIWIRYAKDRGVCYEKDMEKWSSIHNTFKFFKLERPPPLEEIERDPILQKRIALMNKMKNHYKKTGLSSPDFSKKSPDEIDTELIYFEEKLHHSHPSFAGGQAP